MSQDQKSDSTNPSYHVSLVRHEGDQEPSLYAMFERTYLSASGGFLGGDVFLEVGEIVTMQIELADQVFQVNARVDGLQFGDVPGVTVTFADCSEAERKTLADTFPPQRRANARRRETSDGYDR